MSCRVCGLRLKKDDRFVLVGFYPSLWKRGGYPWLISGPEVFGDLYHEDCYLKSIENQESNRKQGVKP